MRLIRAKDYSDVSRKAANIIAAQMQLKPDCVLGLATGSSPVGTYKELIAKYESGELDFSQVKTVNLDEYVGLTGDHDQSYRYFMNDNLFSKVNIDLNNTYVPDGTIADSAEACAKYEEIVRATGGVDLQLLGLGHNGHIGFNEPADSFVVPTHVVELGETTINANARFFSSADEVPKKAVTMGIKAIMQAKKVLLIANGPDKKAIVEKALYGPVTPEVPASILQFHPDLTVVYCFE